MRTQSDVKWNNHSQYKKDEGVKKRMQMLKDAILERGKALNQDVLLVDSFLNHQVDVALM